MNKVICISRQYASAGRTIGHRLGEKLGIKCYDSSLLAAIAEKTGLDKKFIEESGEYASSANWILSAISARGFYGSTIQDDVFKVQCETIREVAAKESCIIVGKNADYILKDHADIFSVFVHANEDERLKRAIGEYHELEDNDDAIRRLRAKDKRRKAYCQLYTDIQWGEARFYDICLDSSRFGIDKCVDILADMYGE